jgi:cell division transport system permease protein
MSKTEEKIHKRRLTSSYLSVVASISLVLFMLGLVGLILLQAHRISTYVKENIGFTIFVHDEVNEADIIRLQKSLDAAVYTKSTEYINKEKAAEELTKDLGEDFVHFLGYNPLLASIEVKLNAEYANPDSIASIEKNILVNPKVKELYYQKSLVAAVNENVRKISLILIGFSVLLLIIAIGLINNSIRLAIYSKRFLIRSMQLVGATSAFIRRPFLLKGMLQGIIGALIALSLLSFIIHSLENTYPEIFEWQDIELFISLFGIVLFLGVFISLVSTALAVRKFLRINLNKLY